MVRRLPSPSNAPGGVGGVGGLGGLAGGLAGGGGIPGIPSFTAPTGESLVEPLLGPNLFSIILFKLFKDLQAFFTMPFQFLGDHNHVH